MNDLLPGIGVQRLLQGRAKWLVSALVLLAAAAGIRFAVFIGTPHGDGRVIRIIEFAKGSSLRRFADELESQGITGSGRLLQVYSRLRGLSNRVQAGTYQLNDGMTPAEILRKLVAGEVYEIRFSLPEGYSIFQAAALLDTGGYFKGSDFLSACRDPGLLREFGVKGASMEGYLYPGTYNLLKIDSAEGLVKLMAQQFARVYADRFAGSEQNIRLSRRQIITLASMIEKEAVVPEEKPVIASVFFNRLNKGMPLQSDPTAVYGIRAFGGRISGGDVRRNTPYNTYLIKGLPPGPIGNPSEGAIAAVFKPAVTGYYYFVARKDGTHQFSVTLDEHNRAVSRYLKVKEPQ